MSDKKRIHEEISLRDQLKEASNALGEAAREYVALRKAATKLILKFDEIYCDPSFSNLFILAKVHEQEYNGPNMSEEFDSLAELLGVKTKTRGDWRP